MSVAPPSGQDRIMIYGPKDDGSTYVVEFRTAEGEVLAISIPRTETAVIRHFQKRMPYGLFVPVNLNSLSRRTAMTQKPKPRPPKPPEPPPSEPLPPAA